jgi:RNA-binding protein YlmH
MAEKDLLAARIDDYLSQAGRGEVAVSNFLTPGEQKAAVRLLAERGSLDSARFWGGYPDAERRCLILFPDFWTQIPDCMPKGEDDPTEAVRELDGETVEAISVTGSGFRKLNHRDYLGAILHLGLERDAIGDIAVQNDFEAVLFCHRRLTEFLCENLTKIANDAVRCAPEQLDETFTDGRHYRPIYDTVASARLDCVVAALTNLSREGAQTAVRSGLVEVDYEAEERIDRILEPPATLSVRGYGRYILRSFDGETKKGRLRIKADQMV